MDLSGEASRASEFVDDRTGGDQQRKEMEVGQTPGWVTRLGKR